MSLFKILETIIIGPLRLLFEILFGWANNVTGHPGWEIIILSIIINTLILPLYKRADVLQEQARDIEKKLSKGVSHIKKTFSGDEKMLILQTYYRQNNYKPTSALKGSISLLLEIPFFIAAYQFLSKLSLFHDTSFGFISNLGAPDQLITLGGITINVFPIAMTLINILSSTILLKNGNSKEKVQLYTTAIVFLFLLYSSPACLTLYWTLNNIYSLVKNIIFVYNPSPILLSSFSSLLGLIVGFYGLQKQAICFAKIYQFFPIIGVLLQIPLLVLFLKFFIKRKAASDKKDNTIVNPLLFFMEMLFITLLTGLVIPSTYISASPQEFIDITYFHNPLWYIVSSFCLSVGTCFLWLNVFYQLFEDKQKLVFESIFMIFCGVMLVNYLFFGTDLGIISPNLKYEKDVIFSFQQQIINLEVVCILAIVLYYFLINKRKFTISALIIINITFICMSTMNLIAIKKSVDNIFISGNDYSKNIPHFTLDQSGKNVVVIMLDRAFNAYVPYIFNELPELKEQFDGFTYYSNTISFAKFTNLATPALLGGYEYTPVEINKRESESLKDKHNEALMVMPVLFSENDYNVTVCDPPYANYQWIPDLSIYDGYPEINTYITKNVFFDENQKASNIINNHRNFYFFAIMKTMPLCWQPYLYDDGNYNKLMPIDDINYTSQTQSSLSVAQGINYNFMENYNALTNLPTMTNIVNNTQNTFLFLSNDITHEPTLLQAPMYEPVQSVDNTQYDAEHTDRFIINNQKLNINNTYQMTHYHVNASAFIILGKWFNYLRDNNVYDNTRIILVADHGRDLNHFEEFQFAVGDSATCNAEYFYPLLMVKDFNSRGFTTCTDFMTNADVPTLATQNLITNPINPFTKKAINNNEKYAHEQYIILSDEYIVANNNNNTFLPSTWASVKDNIWEPSNWTFSEEEVVLKEHALP